jgi:putative inorganic carbon (hco3(-)) transporter
VALMTMRLAYRGTVRQRRTSLRGGRERLAFNLGAGTVPSRTAVEAAIAAGAKPTFATVQRAEPREWGYVGLLAFTAVLLLRPQDQIPALQGVPVAEICAICGLAPMLLHRFANRLPMFRVTPELLGLVAFGCVIVGTAPFSVWPGGALEVFTGSYFKILLVFVLMMNTLTTPKRLEQLTWLILLCFGYIAALAVFNYARGVRLVEGGRLAGPVGGFLGNPNDLALNMVTFMPLAAVVALGRHQPALKRLISIAIAALMLAVVVFTKSRGGALGLVLMLTALVLIGRTVRPGFGVIALVGVLFATPFMPQSFWNRMASIFNEEVDKRDFTGSSEARRILLTEGIETFMERPFTGVGAGQFKNYNPPQRKERWRETHNVLIQVAAETGILGLMVFTFLIVSGAVAALVTRRMLVRSRKRRGADPLRLVMSERDRESLYAHTVAMTAGLIGWFVCAIFASVAYGWTFYYLLALIVAARELTKDRIAAGQALEAETDAAWSVA